MEFVGHGMAGLSHSKAWIPYFALFGFSADLATNYLMNMTGVIDITLGVLTLFYPTRAVLLWMTLWGVFTSVLRPLTGESFFELVERGANYGTPLALLWLYGWGYSLKDWFGKARGQMITEDLVQQLAWIMRFSIALLLVGHGGLGIWAQKKEWLNFFGSWQAAHWVGSGEVALGLAVLIKPARILLIFILGWKIATELLRPVVGQPIYQFIERGGDYALPIALFWLMGILNSSVTRVR